MSKTFLIVSLPDVIHEEIFDLDVSYTVVRADLSVREEALLKACTVLPYCQKIFADYIGTEMLFALALLSRLRTDGQRIEWTSDLLSTRDDEAEQFGLREIDSRHELAIHWSNMPAHDVYLSGINIVGEFKSGFGYGTMLKTLTAKWQDTIKQKSIGYVIQTKEERAFQEYLLEMDANWFVQSTDDEEDE